MFPNYIKLVDPRILRFQSREKVGRAVHTTIHIPGLDQSYSVIQGV